jgi:hypothetical protein
VFVGKGEKYPERWLVVSTITINASLSVDENRIVFTADYTYV